MKNKISYKTVLLLISFVGVTVLVFLLPIASIVNAVTEYWSQSGNNAYYTSGNVGIGTNSPTTLLHVKGNSGYGSQANPVKMSEVYDGDGEFNKLQNPVFTYVYNNNAYVASNEGITIMDVSNPYDPVKKAEIYDGDGQYNKLLGPQGISVSGDYAYVLAEAAMTIIDISNPASPTLISEVYNGDGEFSMLGNGNIRVAGDYAYLTSHTEDALTIIDITDPSDPELKSVVYDGDGEFNKMDQVYALSVSGNYAYLGSRGMDNALVIMDISDPANPIKKAEISDGVGGFNGLAHIEDIHVVGDYVYLTSATEGVTIADISNPNSPVFVSAFYDGDGEFTKLQSPRGIFVEGNYAYINSYGEDSLTIVDVSNPSDPVLVSEIFDGDGQFSRMDGGIRVQVSGNYAYITSYGHSTNGGFTIAKINSFADTEVLSATNDGKVGIGTSTPAATLDINGFIKLEKQSSQPIACSSSTDGSIALSSSYRTCVCKNGTGWVYTSDGTSFCSW